MAPFSSQHPLLRQFLCSLLQREWVNSCAMSYHRLCHFPEGPAGHTAEEVGTYIQTLPLISEGEGFHVRSCLQAGNDRRLELLIKKKNKIKPFHYYLTVHLREHSQPFLPSTIMVFYLSSLSNRCSGRNCS